MSVTVASRASAELTKAVDDRDAATGALHHAVIHAAEAGMSQRQIAKVLGVTQSAVSQMMAATRARALLMRGPIGRKLAEHRVEVLDIARSRGASNVRVFGSVARGEDDEDSDLDLLVDMPGLQRLTEAIGLGYELADLIGAPVDVTPEQMVKRDALRALAASTVPL